MLWFDIADKLLPPVYRAIKDMYAYAKALNDEFLVYVNFMERILKNFFIQTCDLQTVEYWERLLGLKVTEGETIEERKQEILEHLNNQHAITEPYVREQIERFFPGNEYRLYFEDGKPYDLNIDIFSEDIDAYRQALAIFWPWLNKMVPAHLKTTMARAIDTEFDRPVVISHGHYTALLADIGLVERSQPPMVALGGTIDTDSQTSVMIEVGKMGGIATRSGFSFVDKLIAGSMPDEGGTVARSGFSFIDKSLSGSMPMDGGTVSEDTGIDIDCYWGDTVTIPAGYTVQSVKSSELFLSKESAYQGMNYSAFWRTWEFSTSSNYDASYFGLGVAPCLEIFLVSDVTQETFRGYYLSWPSSKTPGGTLPVAYRGVKVNEDGYVFWIDAAYQNTTDPYYVESDAHAYFCRVRLYDANGDQELWAFDFPSAFWQYQNGAFTWLGDPSQGISTGVYYYSTHGKTLIRIHCVPA